jgi:transposase
VLLRYRFRIYPTLPQRAALSKSFGFARVVFNDAVAARKRAHAEGAPYPTTAVLSKSLITEAKQTSQRAWLAEVSSVVLRQALADCDRAYKNFFDWLKGKRAGARMGPPRFKKCSAAQSIRFTRNSKFRVLECGKLRLPKIGEVKGRLVQGASVGADFGHGDQARDGAVLREFRRECGRR